MPGTIFDPACAGSEKLLFVTDFLWCCAEARTGGTCRSGMASGRRCIAASASGALPALGAGFRGAELHGTTSPCCSTMPLSAPASRLRAGRERQRPGAGAMARQTDHQALHAGGRAGPTAPAPSSPLSRRATACCPSSAMPNADALPDAPCRKRRLRRSPDPRERPGLKAVRAAAARGDARSCSIFIAQHVDSRHYRPSCKQPPIWLRL
jgi:hypothetical protein